MSLAWMKMPENCCGLKSKGGAMNPEKPRRWVLASHNPHKAEELDAMIRPFGINLLPLSEFQITEVPKESGTTFRENALIKARAAWRACNCPALADDSGLEVDALDGLPGVLSAQYAGAHASDEQNVNLLLEQLSGKENRRARFQCVLCLWDGNNATYWEGQMEGQILTARRGRHGFGYDPVFEADKIPGHSLAELEPFAKNVISHRAMAVQSMLASLDSI
jgi:XTP/dITP diphosphohydrolase